MASQTVLLKVGMSCQGCVGAVTRVLTKLEGVESFDVDIKAQKVTVNTNLEPQLILEKVSKTGKKTEFWKDETPVADEAPIQAAVAPAVIEAIEALSNPVVGIAESVNGTVETAQLTTIAPDAAAVAPPVVLATAEPIQTPASA